MPLPVPLSSSKLEELAATYGTPFQLYDEEAIRTNCRALLKAMKARFPDFKEFFAVKALPNPAILRILVEEGCGLDCSSTAELHIAHALGVKGADVMYTSNYTSKKDLAMAFDQGVHINLDDISLVDDLVKIRGRCPEMISFRLNPGLGRTDSETASNVLGGPDAKFGVAPFQIVEGYRKAKAAGATRFGMHMMTGSCVLNTDYWRETVGVLLDTVAQVHRELGITFDFINIGGGLGIPYRPGQPGADVEAVAAAVAETVKARWAAHGLPGSPPRLYMENGRFMTGPFGWLVARCEVVKDTWAKYYGLDACMANLMRPGMYNSYHFITVPAREEGALASTVPRVKANVVGTLCENNDWFAKDRDGLPSTASAGDLFVIHDTGAHSHSMGFQYNGKLRAPELLIRAAEDSQAKAPAAGAFVGPKDGRRVDVIRERETVHCLFDNTSLPDDLTPPRAGLPQPYPYHGRPGSAGGDANANVVSRSVGTVGKGRFGLSTQFALGLAAGVVAALAFSYARPGLTAGRR